MIVASVSFYTRDEGKPAGEKGKELCFAYVWVYTRAYLPVQRRLSAVHPSLRNADSIPANLRPTVHEFIGRGDVCFSQITWIKMYCRVRKISRRNKLENSSWNVSLIARMKVPWWKFNVGIRTEIPSLNYMFRVWIWSSLISIVKLRISIRFSSFILVGNRTTNSERRKKNVENIGQLGICDIERK